jgi:hypothetical protein
MSGGECSSLLATDKLQTLDSRSVERLEKV